MSTRKHLIHGVIYNGIAKYSGMLISLVVMGVLSRILSPEDIGVVAIATVLIAFFAIFSDLGIAPAIVQHKQLTERDLSNIYSFTIWSGLALSVLFFFASWGIAAYYESPVLVSICQWLSVNLFFATVNIVPNALLMRDKRFKFIAYRTAVVQSICGAIAIVAAYMGAGVYALLINPILGSIAIYILSLREYPQKAHMTLGLESVRKIFSFSAYQFLFNTINYFSRNLDKILIGRYIGIDLLGYYERSYRLMLLPLQNITSVLTPVMHPVLSDLQNDLRSLASAYQKIVRLLAFIGFPMSVLLFFTAKELVFIVFGDQWAASVPVFKIFATSVGIQMILSSSGAIFQSANATKTLFLSGVLSTTLTVVATVVGIWGYGSLEAVAGLICVSFAVNFVQCYLLMYKVTFRLPIAPFFRQLVSPLLLSVLIFGALYAVDMFLPPMPNVPSLVVKSVAAGVIALAYIQLTGELDLYGKVRSLVKR